MIATIVLAAGGATRFGSPKLLAEWWGRPLVEWTLRSAPDDGPRIAVVGRETLKLRPLFAQHGFSVVRNVRPSDGLASSLRVGLAHVPRECDAALILLGDAPDLPVSVIERVSTAYRRENVAVAAAYDGERGHPVVLPRAVWGQIPATGERAGATIDAALIECGDLAPGSDDVDTPADLFRLAARRAGCELTTDLGEVEARMADPARFIVQTTDDPAGVPVLDLRERAISHGRMIQVVARVGTDYAAIVG